MRVVHNPKESVGPILTDTMMGLSLVQRVNLDDVTVNLPSMEVFDPLIEIALPETD